MKKILISIITVILLWGCNGTSIHTPKVNYLMWKYQVNEETGEWRFAVVPGSIHISLQRDTVIKDLKKASINGEANKYSDKEWVYVSNFYMGKKMLNKEKTFLVFESIDTYADIYLNNQLLGKSNDFYREYRFDITNKVKEGNNSVKVVFHPTIEEAQKFYKSLDFKVPDGPLSVLRKPVFQLTQERGYAYNSIGLSLPAYVVNWNKLYVEDVSVSTKEVSDTLAKVNISIKIHSANKFKGRIKINSQYESLLSKKIEFKEGVQTLNYTLNIKKPKLWHPAGYGKQHLYKFTINFYSGNKLIENEKVTYGIKNIRVETTDNKLKVYDNGKRIYMKIAELNPAHIDMGIANYNQLLTSLVLSGFNSVILWDKGYYPKDDFYEACDKKGIMVIQPFMLPSKALPVSDTLTKLISQESIEVINRLKSHVSIIMWTGKNNKKYQKQIQNYPSARKKKITGYNVAIFDKLLAGLVAKYDSGRAYSSTFAFDNLAYIYNKIPALPSSYTMNKIKPTEFSFDDTLYKQITYPHSEYEMLHKKLKSFNALENKKKAVYISQITQAKQLEEELHYNLFNTKEERDGIVIGWINDYSRVISPSTIDKDGFWKASQYVLKNTMGNFFIDIKSKGNTIYTTIETSIDTPKVLVYYKLYNFEGKLLWQRVENKVMQRRLTNSFDLGLFLSIYKKNYVVFKTEIYYNQELAAEKYHYFVPENELKLKEAKIEKNFYKIDKGYALELTSDFMAQKVHIISNDKNVIIENNFVDILPGESKIIIIHTNKVIPDIKTKFKIYSLYDYLNGKTEEKKTTGNKATGKKK